MYRLDREAYNSLVRSQVEASKKDIPEGLKIPTSTDDFVVQKKQADDDQDENFWYASDEDEDIDEDMDDYMSSEDEED